MGDITTDFGTGLRAHLGLDRAELDLVPEPAPEPVAAPGKPGPSHEELLERLEALRAHETLLVERQRSLTIREATLAGSAGGLLAAAQALYDEVLGGGPSPHDDEVAQRRRRKSVA